MVASGVPGRYVTSRTRFLAVADSVSEIVSPEIVGTTRGQNEMCCAMWASAACCASSRARSSKRVGDFEDELLTLNRRHQKVLITLAG